MSPFRGGPADPNDPFESGSAVARIDELLASSPVVLYSAAFSEGGMVPVWVSGNVMDILGYEVQETLTPGWWFSHVHPDDIDRAVLSAPALLKQDEYTHEYRFCHANGAYIRMLDQIRVIERGDARVVVGSWTDVSGVRAQQEQLEAAHAHYHRLIHTSPYPIYTLDTTGCFTEVNAAAERLLGRTDLLGTSFAEVIAPDDMDLARQFFEEVMTGEHDSLERELRIQRPNGDLRLLSVSVAPIRGDVVTGAHGLARDITDERRIAQERERARQQYERLVTTSPDAIYALDLEGRFTEVSRATAELLGRSVDELIGMPFSSIIAPEDMATAATAFQRRLDGDTVVSEFDLHVIRKDGERRLVHIRGTHISDGERILGSQGIGRDITEEREREERMVQLSTALDRLPDGVCITDEQHRLVYANSACYRLLGTRLDAAGTVDTFAETIGNSAELEQMRSSLKQHGAWRGAVTHESDTHDAVPIEIVAVHVVMDEQTLTFSVLRDMTAEIAREQQLRRAERLASVGTLVAGVAHELNNPLTAIGGFAELMLMEPQSDENREMLELTMREATRAARIVAELRLLARATQHSAPSSRGPVDLNDVVDHVLKLQRYTLDTSNIRVDVDLAADLPPVHGNASELEQVVLNLIVNARQALDEKSIDEPRITVRTRPANGGATLRIADNGPGIAQQYLERVFDPFFTTKSPGQGMGLGLSLVHRIVTEHDGHVQVESSAGTGAAFVVSLPRAGIPKAAAAPAQHEAVANLRILVVDDEESIRRALLRYLRRRGHTADAASDGREALQLIESHAYDIILTDLRMPGMGGELLLDALRERDPHTARRVIFMTGHVARDDATITSDYADVPLIEKPFSLTELGRQLEEIAARINDAAYRSVDATESED